MPAKIAVNDISKSYVTDKGPLQVIGGHRLDGRRRRVRGHRRALRLRQDDAAQYHCGIRSARSGAGHRRWRGAQWAESQRAS